MAKQPATTPEEIPEVEVLQIKGKFQCTHAVDQSEGIVSQIRAMLSPITGESLDGSGNGNESWSIGTPNGVLALTVTTEDMQAFFEAGKHYAITITPIDPELTPLDLH